MKKIALFIYSDVRIFPPTVNAANLLAEKGHPVYIFDIDYGKSTKESISLHPSVKRISLFNKHTGLKNVLSYFSLPFKLIFKLFKYKINVLISYDGMSILPAYTASIIKKNITWVYHQHDYWETASGWHKIPFIAEKKLIHKASIISFPQQARADRILTGKSKEKLVIVHNGPCKNWISNIIQIPYFEEIKAQYNSPPIMIYQGGLSPSFSLDVLINAISLINKPIHFIMIGKELSEGYKSYLYEIANKNGVEKQIHIIDVVPYEHLPSYAKYGHIGVAKFSFKENEITNDLFLAGASNKLTEYMACGLPIMAPNTTTNIDFIQTKGRGIVVDPENINEVAKTIVQFIDNKKLRNTISANNKKEFDEEFAFDIQFEKLYLKINSHN